MDVSCTAQFYRWWMVRIWNASGDPENENAEYRNKY
jgi:hypothetical protein